VKPAALAHLEVAVATTADAAAMLSGWRLVGLHYCTSTSSHADALRAWRAGCVLVEEPMKALAARAEHEFAMARFRSGPGCYEELRIAGTDTAASLYELASLLVQSAGLPIERLTEDLKNMSGIDEAVAAIAEVRAIMATLRETVQACETGRHLGAADGSCVRQ
jgi:hypothetical protein